MSGLDPVSMLNHAKAIANQVYRGEVDRDIRSNLYTAITALGNAAIQIETRDRRAKEKK